MAVSIDRYIYRDKLYVRSWLRYKSYIIQKHIHTAPIYTHKKNNTPRGNFVWCPSLHVISGVTESEAPPMFKGMQFCSLTCTVQHIVLNLSWNIEEIFKFIIDIVTKV